MLKLHYRTIFRIESFKIPNLFILRNKFLIQGRNFIIFIYVENLIKFSCGLFFLIDMVSSENSHVRNNSIVISWNIFPNTV